jgi:hypothetical protein
VRVNHLVRKHTIRSSCNGISTVVTPEVARARTTSASGPFKVDNDVTLGVATHITIPGVSFPLQTWKKARTVTVTERESDKMRKRYVVLQYVRRGKNATVAVASPLQRSPPASTYLYFTGNMTLVHCCRSSIQALALNGPHRLCRCSQIVSGRAYREDAAARRCRTFPKRLLR